MTTWYDCDAVCENCSTLLYGVDPDTYVCEACGFDASRPPVPNVALLDATLAHVADHPDTWEQSVWVTTTPCGTAACFAGWALLLSGYRHEEDVDLQTDFIVDDAHGPVNVREAARKRLGLTPAEATDLFDSGNDLRDLRGYVDTIRAR